MHLRRRSPRRSYRRKITGPITDRIDISRYVEPVGTHEVGDPLARAEPTAAVRARVARGPCACSRAVRRARPGGSTPTCPAPSCATTGR